MLITKRLRDDCGGARFLDLPSLAVLGSFALVSSVLSSAPPNLSTSWRWTLVNLAALGVTAVPVLLARRGLRARSERPVALGLTMAIGAAIGAAKGVSTSLLGASLNLIDNLGIDLVARTVNTAFVGAVVIPATAALMAALDRWRAEREMLTVELVRRALEEGSAERTPYRQQLETLVAQAQRRLPNLAADAAAAEMRHLVDRHLRPLSTAVLTSTVAAPPVMSGWDLVRAGAMTEPWARRVVTVIYAITTWLLLTRHIGLIEATVFSTLVAVTLASLFALARVMQRRWPSTAFMTLLGVVVLMALGQRLLAHFTIGAIDSLDHVGIPIASSLWLLQLVLASAALTAARHERDVIRLQLLNLLGPQGVRDVIAHGLRAVDGREFAFFVHGDLQNQLIAAAQRLESAQDPTVVESTKHSVVELLQRAQVPHRNEVRLSERLRDMTARWEGIAQIAVTTPADIDATSMLTADRITHVLTEAITNAVRHGAAQQIDIEITRHSEALTIVVTDDGFGPRRGRPGTGSRYLDLVAPRSWTLTPAPAGGARLTLRLTDETS